MELQAPLSKESLPRKQSGASGAPIMYYLAAVASGALWAMSYPGFDVWPLAWVAFVPLLIALEVGALPTRRGFLCGWLCGFVANFIGHYWLVEMLQKFSGFPTPLCIFFAAGITAWQGLLAGCFSALWLYLRRRGCKMVAVTVIAWVLCEAYFPVLFQNYFAATLHTLPVLLQIVDLGGPLLATALLLGVNGLLAELFVWRTRKTLRPNLTSAAVIAGLVATLGYGVWRMHEVEARVEAAPTLRVGVVQANMGIYAKRLDPVEGLRRHIEQSQELERSDQPDLIVWPESAVSWYLTPQIKSLKKTLMEKLSTPILFGGLYRDQVGDQELHYNTAFITDKDGSIMGHYHKTYLLAFGEYLPFGELFPQLYDLSPHSGHFTKGTTTPPLPLGPWRISALVCYEDILPGFVRRAVREARPHLLVNMTNDAWFGDSTEPWTHLALAKLRAVEHHRFLVRATNSGVSAFVDPLGRTVTRSGVFERATLSAPVAMMSGRTLYSYLGDWPAYLALVVLAWFLASRYFSERRGASKP